MEKRIALEKRGLADDKIQELILDNCRSTSIEGLTDSFTALEVLSLINVGLVSLKSFPKLPALRKLELSDNRISNALSHLTGSPKLTHLNLSGNRIKDFDELKPLKDLENLEVLDLFNNEVTMTQNYREKIFELIPSLKYLDGFDKEDLEAPSDEEDEANAGADDQEDDRACFSINGIEFDLDELERFELQLKQKRAPPPASSGLSGIESRLEQLELRQVEDEAATAKDDLDLLYEEIQRKKAEKQELVVPPDPSTSSGGASPSSLGSLLLAFLSLLAFINQICYVQANRQQLIEKSSVSSVSSVSSDYDDYDDNEEFEQEDEDNDGTLADVYNDNIGDDSSDWVDESEICEDSDEPTDDEENDGEGEAAGEGEKSGPESEAAEAEAAESEARGKKRKLDGNDG